MCNNLNNAQHLCLQNVLIIELDEIHHLMNRSLVHLFLHLDACV